MQSKVLSSDLKIGMFVAVLDRPWIDTPFMLQGFLIESDEDVRLLRQYCDFVQVDWSMSPIAPPSTVLQQQKVAKAAQTAAPLQVQVNAASNIIRPSSQPATSGEEKNAAIEVYVGLDSLAELPLAQTITRSSSTHTATKDQPVIASRATDHAEQGNLFAEITGRFKSFFNRASKAPKTKFDSQQTRVDFNDAPLPYVRPEFIPADIPIAMYVDATPAEQEVAPALQAHKRAKEVFSNLVHDIQSNKHLALEETEVVVNEVVDSMVRNPDAMMWITRLRKQDEVIYGHGLQVAVYLVALGRHLGLPKDMLERLCTMGLLLDIGKIKLPKTVLLKEERLTADEFELIKSHVKLSIDILKETPDIHSDVLQGISQHHERENGSGYPAGLFKDEIGLFGRMAGIVDTFAALTNPRSYAKTIPAYEALQTLSNFNQGLYPASMVEQFIQAIGVFPVGSMVELSTSEVAIVVGHSKVRRLKPRVLIISDAEKRPALEATTLDLMYQSVEAGSTPITILRGLPTGAYGLDVREYYLT
jgi:HD-GYP domain-containing protein (c-di-GMP phosphodiesterase class II)